MNLNQNEMNTYSIRSFALASMICGILALMTFFTGFFSLITGGLGIMFAVLSRREDRPFPSLSWWGVVFSCIGIFMGALVLIYAIMTILIPLMTDPNYYQEMNTMYQNLYGINLDDIFRAQ